MEVKSEVAVNVFNTSFILSALMEMEEKSNSAWSPQCGGFLWVCSWREMGAFLLVPRGGAAAPPATSAVQCFPIGLSCSIFSPGSTHLTETCPRTYFVTNPLSVFDHLEVPLLGGVGPVCLGWFKRLVNNVRKLAHESSLVFSILSRTCPPCPYPHCASGWL